VHFSIFPFFSSSFSFSKRIAIILVFVLVIKMALGGSTAVLRIIVFVLPSVCVIATILRHERPWRMYALYWMPFYYCIFFSCPRDVYFFLHETMACLFWRNATQILWPPVEFNRWSHQGRKPLKQSKAKQRCVMGVGMCLYAQLVQTKNK